MTHSTHSARPHRWRLALALAIVIGLVAQHQAAALLIDKNVAGALLAGGGGLASVLAAGSLMLCRIAGTVFLSLLPVVVVARSWPRATTWYCRRVETRRCPLN